MKSDQLKSIILGILLGFALVLLMGSNDQNINNDEFFNGRYRFYESRHNPEKLYLIDVHNGNMFIWDHEFDHWQEQYSELKRY